MTDTGAPQDGGHRPRNLLRDLSDQAVLEAIFREGPITRPELSTRTGLSKPTVSESVRRLMQERLIRSAGVRSGNLGRSPVSYVVDDAAGYVIGVDVGGANIRVAAVNLFGELLSSRSEPLRQDGGRGLDKQVHAVVREMIRVTAATHSQLLAVAAARTEKWPAEATDAEDPLERLAEQIGVPVFTDSGINLSAIGEKWRGLAGDVSDFVFVTVGAGVGAGIVVSDQLVRGAHFGAGDIAGIPGARGRRVSALGSTEGMEADALLERARTLDWKGPTPDTIAAIFDRADTEPAARKLIKWEATQLSYAVATICAVVDPELVVLGGGIGSYPALLEPVREMTEPLLSHPVRIESSSLREHAALYGALAVALRDAHEQLFRRGGYPKVLSPT